MSLEPTNWMNREQHKVNNDPKQLYPNETHQQVRGHKIPVKQFVVPAESVNRFTQTEQATLYDGKDIFDANLQQQQQAQQQQQVQQQTQQAQGQLQHQVAQHYTLDKKDDKQPPIPDFPFCYNVNMLQKVQQVQQNNATNNLILPSVGEDKSYRFDVAQPFSYNYALVNQMSLAAAASSVSFKCDVCGLAFAHISLLNHHKRIHNNNNTGTITERVFVCETCGSTFGQVSDLKNHKLSVHNSPPKSTKCASCGVDVECDHTSKKKNKNIRCENCVNNSERDSLSFQGSQEVGTETEEIPKGMHAVKKRGMATVTKCHKCNGSGIIFVGPVQNQVEKPYHCNICDGTFSRYSSLWSHKRLHSGDKPFKCDYCGLTFARAAYLKNHARVHSGERPFKCEICGMQFSQAPHLKNHERIHSGERPYECEVCNKTFARHSTLWNHRRIHTGEKPYRCNICGSAFNQATHLKNHAKVHTGEKPHRCDICEVGFSDRFALKRHRGVHEKYGQTAPNRTNQQQHGMDDLYNRDVESDASKQNHQSNQSSQPRLDELYKCDVTGGIAFPGCSRPQEAK